MKTCGRILDTPKGKLRMDQYIERLEQTIDNPQMPLRIRFMLQVIQTFNSNSTYTLNPRCPSNSRLIVTYKINSSMSNF